MVLLIERLSKLYSKLENHRHHRQQQQKLQTEALSASLQAFQSTVSNSVNRQLLLNLEPGSEIFSLSWIQRCFLLLPIMNRAFAKLVVDLEFPVSKWSFRFFEQYLNYSLGLLDHLNSISSALSHLGHARLLLSHALSLVETSPSSAIERLKAIKFEKLSKDLPDVGGKKDEQVHKCSSDKEGVVYQALIELRSIGFWVCGVVLAGLRGDSEAYLKLRKPAIELSSSSLINLDSRICTAISDKWVILKDVEELNEAAAGLAAAAANGKFTDEAEEMRRRLELFERLVDGLWKEVDLLFSELLAGRDELVDEIINGKKHEKQDHKTMNCK